MSERTTKKSAQKTISVSLRPRRKPGTAVSVVLCLYFALVAIAFWGPYVGLVRYAAPLTAVYGLFVLLVAATAALRFLRHFEETRRGR